MTRRNRSETRQTKYLSTHYTRTHTRAHTHTRHTAEVPSQTHAHRATHMPATLARTTGASRLARTEYNRYAHLGKTKPSILQDRSCLIIPNPRSICGTFCFLIASSRWIRGLQAFSTGITGLEFAAVGVHVFIEGHGRIAHSSSSTCLTADASGWRQGLIPKVPYLTYLEAACTVKYQNWEGADGSHLPSESCIPSKILVA